MSVAHDPDHIEDPVSKRQQILDAAYNVFSRKGFHRSTIDEIIALADTGKGTVYNYFVNKEKLFYTLTCEISQPFEADLERVVHSEVEPLQKLRQLVELFLVFYNEHGDLWRVVMHELRGFGSEGYSHMGEGVRNTYHEFFQRSIGTMEQALVEGMNCGVIRPCDPVVTAHGMFSVIVMMAFQRYIGDDAEEAAARVTNTFFYGIASAST